MKTPRPSNAKAAPRRSTGRQPTPPGDDLGAADLARRLAETLRQFRRSRDWSLDDLAQASGVSRAALWQIETCKSNPSIGVIWKIASGLGVPFSELFTQGGDPIIVQRWGHVQPLRSGDGRLESRLVSPPGGSFGVELYELRLAARSSHAADAHPAGTREIVTVLSGALKLKIGNDVHELGLGDAVAFPADRPHVYENPGGSEARYHDIIVYRR